MEVDVLVRLLIQYINSTLMIDQFAGFFPDILSELQIASDQQYIYMKNRFALWFSLKIISPKCAAAYQ